MTTQLSSPINFIKTLFTHLWLSVSSVKFYENVFKNYKGYGALYILNLSLISSLICTVIFLNNVNEIRNYFNNDIISAKTENIDFVLKQLPAIDFDGQRISIEDNNPIFIKNKNGKNVIAIDPANQIKPSDRDKYPILLSKDKMIIKLINSQGEAQNTFPIKLDQIFNSAPQILSKEVVKSTFAKLFDHAPRLFIYMIFPLTGFLIFLNTFLDKSFFIVMIFFVSRISKINIPMKSCIRLSMYASGFYALFQFIFTLAAPEYSSIIWFIQTWSNILMILGILSATGKNYFFNKMR